MWSGRYRWPDGRCGGSAEDGREEISGSVRSVRKGHAQAIGPQSGRLARFLLGEGGSDTQPMPGGGGG